MIPKLITFKYIRGWQYDIVQVAENEFCVVRTNRKEKRGKHGEPIREGISYTERCFKTLKEAKKYLEKLKDL